MITFRNIIDNFSTIAYKHININSFHSGFLDEVDIDKLNAKDYKILYVEPNNSIINTGVLTYTFNVYILDQINDSVGKQNGQVTQTVENRQKFGRIDAFSENLQILQDVINEFKQNLSSISFIDNEIILNTPITAEPFNARFNNLLTGWTATLELEVNNTNNLCISPIY